MNWNRHSEIKEGSHAFLSASKYAWLGYSDDKLKQTYLTSQAAEDGTKLHKFASDCINYGFPLNEDFTDNIKCDLAVTDMTKKTVAMFVNDCIKFKMRSEQILYYSELCFGTADGISFDEELKILRIFDLKTGTHKASMMQLEVYSALFCIEYCIVPNDINVFELRIYQNGERTLHSPSRKRIQEVIDKIINADLVLQEVI